MFWMRPMARRAISWPSTEDVDCHSCLRASYSALSPWRIAIPKIVLRKLAWTAVLSLPEVYSSKRRFPSAMALLYVR